MAQKNEEEPITKLEIDKSRRKLDFTEQEEKNVKTQEAEQD